MSQNTKLNGWMQKTDLGRESTELRNHQLLQHKEIILITTFNDLMQERVHWHACILLKSWCFNFTRTENRRLIMNLTLSTATIGKNGTGQEYKKTNFPLLLFTGENPGKVTINNLEKLIDIFHGLQDGKTQTLDYSAALSWSRFSAPIFKICYLLLVGHGNNAKALHLFLFDSFI